LILQVGFRGQAIRWRHSRFWGSKRRCHSNHFWLSVYEVHIGPTWWLRLNRPCPAAMQPHVKLLWPLVLILVSFTTLHWAVEGGYRRHWELIGSALTELAAVWLSSLVTGGLLLTASAGYRAAVWSKSPHQSAAWLPSASTTYPSVVRPRSSPHSPLHCMQ